MGRPERPLDPEADPLQRFAFDLRRLRQQAGGPSYRQLAKRAHYSATALSEAAGGEQLPSLAVTVAYVEACGGDREEWRARWHAVAAQLESDEAEPGPAEQAADDAPYLGLATFQPEDTDRFFGRRELIGELVSRLVTARFLAVFGASGSGKSSLLRAGLLPALWATGRETLTVLFAPGRHPLEELAIRVAGLHGISPGSLYADLVADPSNLDLAVRQALATRPPGAQTLLVIDQFEEVFTLCAEEQERMTFIEALLSAVTEHDRARVALGVRADFYSHCARYPALVTALRDAQVLVGPMSSDELREAIVEPARRVGLGVEPALVAALLGEVASRPGSLPLLSHALLETWRRRRGNTLTLAGYRAAGGIERAIGDTAERVYGQLSLEQQAITRNVFQRLTALGEGTEDTRRRVARSELMSTPDRADVERVLDRLAKARLVTLGADSVEVAHEALIREWPRLRRWLTDDREALRLHRRLTEAAAEWEDGGREDGFLYRGARLAAWQDRSMAGLNDLEQAFLDASRQREARERTTGRRRVRLIVAGLSLALALISTLAVTAAIQRDEAREQRDLALSRQLATSASTQLAIDPELSILLARQAYAIRPIAEAETVLRQAVLESRVRRTLHSHDGSVQDVAFSLDGRYLASAGDDGAVRVWELFGRNEPTVLRHDGPVRDVAFTPDGDLVSGGDDGIVRIWDPARTAVVAALHGHGDTVNAVAISRDGQRIASASSDTTVRIWDRARGTVLAVLHGHQGVATSVDFSPDSRLVASTGDTTLRIWDWATGRTIESVLSHEGSADSVAFGPDGQQAVTTGADGVVRIWNAAGTDKLAEHRGHLRRVNSVVFSLDGQRVASASEDGTARVWEPLSNDEPVVLRGHKSPVRGVTFHPDREHVATAGVDGTVRIWDLTTAVDPLVLRGHERSIGGVSLSPDAQSLASASDDSTVRIWDLTGRKEPLVLRHHDRPVYVAVFSPDGQQVASASEDSTVRIWDLVKGRQSILEGSERAVFDVAFAPDGRRLASAGGDRIVRVWDLANGGPPSLLQGHTDSIYEVAFSPNGRWVASSSDDSTIRVWDVAGGGQLAMLREHEGPVGGVAFSPDGWHVASTGHDGTVRTWDWRTQTQLRELRGHEAPVNNASFSPDGRRLATGSGDATVRIWDPASGVQLVVFRGHGAAVYGVIFTPDGRQVISASEDATVRVWQCETCGPIHEVLTLAEQRSTRPLTPEERATFLLGQ